MRTALIGLSQSGKKTLFRLLTGREVPPGRRPDEAIEGRAQIRDPRVDALSALCLPEKTVYAENQFVLCPDAVVSGDTRPWLEAARKCDLLCLVTRSFESESVFHPQGSIDALRDRSNLESELLLADMAMVETRLGRIEKESKGQAAAANEIEKQTLDKAMAWLSDGQRLMDIGFDAQALESIKSLNLLTLIPILNMVNVSEDELNDDAIEGAVAISAKIEEEIAEMDDATERAEYLAAVGLTSSGVDRMNAAAYDALGLMSFYTIGKDEVRAWTIRKASTAPIAGGKVHTDIQRGFIRVEVINYDDLIEAGSENAARDAGKMQTRGKDYVMQDGDVCHFLFNV